MAQASFNTPPGLLIEQIKPEGKMAQRHTDILWRKYFSDPSQWWDNRCIKSCSTSPDFKHKTTQESLWIGGKNNSSWARKELSKRGILISSITYEEP
ncbi:hypothetical protein GOP47_0021336, partial [Adiantum capillus-veneris]